MVLVAHLTLGLAGFESVFYPGFRLIYNLRGISLILTSPCLPASQGKASQIIGNNHYFMSIANIVMLNLTLHAVAIVSIETLEKQK